MLKYKGRTDLTASEARQIFQDALERELVRAIDPYLEPGAEKDKLVLTSKFWAGAYREAQRSVEELRALQQEIYLAPGGVELPISRDAGIAWLVAEMKRNEVEEECPSALERAGVPVNPDTLTQALVQRLRGRAAAHERAQLAADPRISSRRPLGRTARRGSGRRSPGRRPPFDGGAHVGLSLACRLHLPRTGPASVCGHH